MSDDKIMIKFDEEYNQYVTIYCNDYKKLYYGEGEEGQTITSECSGAIDKSNVS